VLSRVVAVTDDDHTPKTGRGTLWCKPPIPHNQHQLGINNEAKQGIDSTKNNINTIDEDDIKTVSTARASTISS